MFFRHVSDSIAQTALAFKLSAQQYPCRRDHFLNQNLSRLNIFFIDMNFSRQMAEPEKVEAKR
jgi:hypothetical protein